MIVVTRLLKGQCARRAVICRASWSQPSLESTNAAALKQCRRVIEISYATTIPQNSSLYQVRGYCIYLQVGSVAYTFIMFVWLEASVTNHKIRWLATELEQNSRWLDTWQLRKWSKAVLAPVIKVVWCFLVIVVLVSWPTSVNILRVVPDEQVVVPSSL